MWVFNLLERRVHPVDREIAQAGALAKSLDTGESGGPYISSWPRLTLQALCRDVSKRCVSRSGVLLVRRFVS
jgi:hypothetical protein